MLEHSVSINKVSLIGTILAWTGIAAAAFSPSTAWMAFTFGFMYGKAALIYPNLNYIIWVEGCLRTKVYNPLKSQIRFFHIPTHCILYSTRVQERQNKAQRVSLKTSRRGTSSTDVESLRDVFRQTRGFSSNLFVLLIATWWISFLQCRSSILQNETQSGVLWSITAFFPNVLHATMGNLKWESG